MFSKNVVYRLYHQIFILIINLTYIHYSHGILFFYFFWKHRTISGNGQLQRQPLFISVVVKGSEAELLGVCVYDQPTNVGGVDVQGMNVGEIVAVINEKKRKKKLMEKIIFKMSR